MREGADALCAHCKQMESKHARDKCLYQPTMWTPLLCRCGSTITQDAHMWSGVRIKLCCLNCYVNAWGGSSDV